MGTADAYEIISDHRCQLGEGPVWDAKRNTIVWLDILKGEIHEFSFRMNKHRSIPVHDLVGTVALCRDGNYIAALKNGLALVNRENEHIRFLCNPEGHLPANRFNDGKCDPAGRFWVGSMSLTEETGAGSLYMIDRDLSCSRKISHVSISNGLAWNPGQDRFYFIDTPTREVLAFDYDRDTGNISNHRVVVRIPAGEGFPDGMTIDREGKLWIAHWDGWQVSRWDPDSGVKLLQLTLPVSRVTSCTFGGNALQDLFITSAREGLTAGQLEEQPLAGALFRVRGGGYTGLETVEFNPFTNIY